MDAIDIIESYPYQERSNMKDNFGEGDAPARLKGNVSTLFEMVKKLRKWKKDNKGSHKERGLNSLIEHTNRIVGDLVVSDLVFKIIFPPSRKKASSMVSKERNHQIIKRRAQDNVYRGPFDYSTFYFSGTPDHLRKYTIGEHIIAIKLRMLRGKDHVDIPFPFMAPRFSGYISPPCSCNGAIGPEYTTIHTLGDVILDFPKPGDVTDPLRGSSHVMEGVITVLELTVENGLLSILSEAPLLILTLTIKSPTFRMSMASEPRRPLEISAIIIGSLQMEDVVLPSCRDLIFTDELQERGIPKQYEMDTIRMVMDMKLRFVVKIEAVYDGKTFSHNRFYVISASDPHTGDTPAYRTMV